MNDAAPLVPRVRVWTRLVDPLIFFALFAGYLAALVATAHTLGYARDEGFYFHAAGTYGKWFELLLSSPGRALTPAVVDRYWQENHEHPALMKSLFWLSQRLFEGSWFHERGTALRFPAMIISALGVATTFAFGRRCIGRAGGLVAALAFALMPQVFYHSHLAAFDMPIASLWLFVVYAYYRSLEPRSLRWAFYCAVLYGLALDTKHNAWYLPPALIAHSVLLALPGFVRGFRRDVRASYGPVGVAWKVRRRRVPIAIILMLVIGPALCFALWPWLWHDTGPRLVAYFKFHLQHVYYNMEYLGRTYFEPPFPRSYALVMTLATVPAITLVLALGGGAAAALAAGRGFRAQITAPVEPAAAEPARAEPAPVEPARLDASDPRSWAPLWLFCLVLSYAPWLLSTTPIFGGTKHWLNAYPFLALFAGYGFTWLTSAVGARRRPGPVAAGAEPASSRLWGVVPWALGVCVLIGPLLMTAHSHPWGLTAYTPLVGGAPGAATLGLNRSFWGYTTGSVVGYLNENMGRGERLFLHDTAVDSFRMLQKDGRLRSDIKPWGTVSGSHFALYHHEQHMTRVEHMTWVDYGTTAPAHVATFDGVPMIWVYRRPR